MIQQLLGRAPTYTEYKEDLLSQSNAKVVYNLSARVVEHKVILHVWTISRKSKNNIQTNIRNLCPTIVGQSDQNSEIRGFQANSLREYPVNVVKKDQKRLLSKSY